MLTVAISVGLISCVLYFPIRFGLKANPIVAEVMLNSRRPSIAGGSFTFTDDSAFFGCPGTRSM